MAKLVVFVHEFDAFAFRPKGSAALRSPYLLWDVLKHLRTLGHETEIVMGPRPVPADVALLHVDSTIVPDEYLALGAHYPRTINFGVRDISKRTISRLLLSRDDDWAGQVIVKANFNNNALMESIHNQRAERRGRPLPHPGVQRGPRYQVFDHLADVPDGAWDDPSVVVERFLPEPDPESGFVIRTWVFMGPNERCTRFVTPTNISKAGDVVRYEPMPVPVELRAERKRLNFDFGKFDFVMHDGKPVLLDANKTPGIATAIEPLMKAGAANLAEGLDKLIRGAA